MQDDKFQYYLKKADSLLNLEEKIINLSIEFDIDIFISLFEKFYTGVVEIRDAFILDHALPVDFSKTNSEAVDFLQAILNNDAFEKLEKKKNKVAITYFIQNAVSIKEGETLEEWLIRAYEQSDNDVIKKYEELGDIGGYDMRSLEDLASNYLYDWFGPYTYIEDLRNAGSILIKSDKLPGNFTHVISTIKQCYAFQQYLAVIVLCRTALEIALRDLYMKLGFTDKGSETNAIAYNYFIQLRRDKKRKYLNEYDPFPADLRKIICKLPEYQEFEEELSELYGKLSRVIHGGAKRVKSRDKAEKFMQETIWLIHELYRKLK